MEGEQSVPTSSSGLANDGVPRARHLQGRTSGPTRRSTKGQWTPEEDEILRQAVHKYNGKNWKKIAESFNDRTDVQCLHRWQKVLNPELVKGPWSKEEDEIIIQLVKQYGPKKWSTIAQHLHGRIGKQCRERWHNHLNPAINKEAWTQEEELILIHAHQTYGNKWAELTKYLPGRSDNAIKNHWNSSVKKKLDSYLASGLLSNLPPLNPSHQPIPSHSQREQASGDDNGPKGADIEEMSECSQDSAVVTCSRSASASGILQAIDEVQLTEDPGFGKEQSFSGTPCSEQFYSLEDVDLSISEIPYEVRCSSAYLAQNFAHDAGPSVSSNCQFELLQSPNISSLQLGVEPSGFQNHSTDCNRNTEVDAVPSHACLGLNPSHIMENFVVSTGKLEKMPSTDDECCKVLFSDAVDDESFLDANNVSEDINLVHQGQGSNPLLCQSLHIQTSESCLSNSNAQGSCHQLYLPGPSVFENIDSTLLYGGESNQLYETQEQGSITAAHDDFVNITESASSPFGNGADTTSMQDQLLVIRDPPKLVPANSFGSGSAELQTCSSKDVKLDVHVEQQDAGALCYEPPHFPSLDIPFFSCDLIQSDSNMLQDFSPLGIRQLMSSVNCISPFRLWDSPSRNDSPDAALRSAAKTFTGTPSILKKRNREMLSPLSDRRIDKKLATDLTADLTKDFSRLDVIFNENMPCSAPILKTPSNLKRTSGTNNEEKENLGHAFEGENRNKDGSISSLSDNILEETTDIKGKSKVYFDADNPTVQLPSGVLVERNANDMQLSPDKDSSNSDKQLVPGTLKNQHYLISEGSSRQSIYLPGTASGNQGLTGVGSPKSSKKENDRDTSSINTMFSAPLEIFVDDVGKDTGFDYLSIFGNTPFKRSIESPSAWKSPWLCNSLLSSPNITIEDFGFSLSPGDRTYDAIGLMKQVSEHTAAAYAEALEVLGNETPETLSKDRRGASQNQEQKDNSDKQLANCPTLSPKFMTECRALDFSECETPKKGVETPGKRTDNGKPSASGSVTSPSSYLLKSCR